GEHHVLQTREAWNDAGQLKRPTDARARSPARRGGAQRPAIEVDLARGGQDLAAQEIEDGRLAGTVGTNEDVDVVFEDVEVDRVDGLERVVGLAQPASGDQDAAVTGLGHHSFARAEGWPSICSMGSTRSQRGAT